MTLTDLIEEVRNKLGYNTGLSSSLITTAISNAQGELEKLPELPWFLHTEISSISTTADEERIAVPADFIKEIDEEPLYYYDTSGTTDEWVSLRKLTTNNLRNIYNLAITNSQEVSGTPLYYALDGAYFRLYPIPDAAYTLKLTYYGKQDVLSAGSDTNGWSLYAPYALIGKAGILLSMNNRDKSGIEIFGALLTESSQLLNRQSEAREHSGMTYQRGGDD